MVLSLTLTHLFLQHSPAASHSRPLQAFPFCTRCRATSLVTMQPPAQPPLLSLTLPPQRERRALCTRLTATLTHRTSIPRCRTILSVTRLGWLTQSIHRRPLSVRATASQFQSRWLSEGSEGSTSKKRDEKGQLGPPWPRLALHPLTPHLVAAWLNCSLPAPVNVSQLAPLFCFQ